MFLRIIVTALLLSTSLSAQTPDQAPTTLKLSTRIVVLDVVVTDKQGKVVTQNLTKDDFTIVEDRVPQTIRSLRGSQAQGDRRDLQSPCHRTSAKAAEGGDESVSVC